MVRITRRVLKKKLKTLAKYSCDSNCRSVVNCSNGLKDLSCNGSIRRHVEIYGRLHGSY